MEEFQRRIPKNPAIPLKKKKSKVRLEVGPMVEKLPNVTNIVFNPCTQDAMEMKMVFVVNTSCLTFHEIVKCITIAAAALTEVLLKEGDTNYVFQRWVRQKDELSILLYYVENNASMEIVIDQVKILSLPSVTLTGMVTEEKVVVGFFGPSHAVHRLTKNLTPLIA